MAVPPQRPHAQRTSQHLVEKRAFPRNSVRTAPCPWCRQSLPPACCADCLNRAARQRNRVDTNAGIEASQQALAASLAEWNRRIALRERRARISDRVAELRATAEQRAAAVRTRRRHLEQKREELCDRRRRHEALSAEFTTARRRLEAKRSRISRDEFLRDPVQHGTSLGAFHVYQELSVINQALQNERRRRCAELISIYPLKWIESDGDGGDRTLTLSQVQSLEAAGVLQVEELKDLEAALSHLLPLTAAVASYLDVTLPFPCTGGQGFAAMEANGEVGREELGSKPKQNSTARSAPWAWPCVLHPFSERWHYFNVYDGICTPEFVVALRLIDESLRLLCATQGEAVPAKLGSLQLLAHLLNAASLGCVSPPAALAPTQAPVTSSISHTIASSQGAWGTRESAESVRLNSSKAGIRARADLESSTRLHKAVPKHRSPRYNVVQASSQSTSAYEDDEWLILESEP